MHRNTEVLCAGSVVGQFLLWAPQIDLLCLIPLSVSA